MQLSSLMDKQALAKHTQWKESHQTPLAKRRVALAMTAKLASRNVSSTNFSNRSRTNELQKRVSICLSMLVICKFITKGYLIC